MLSHITVKDGSSPPWQNAPGSPEAADDGCTCSQARNNFGKGAGKGNSRRWYPSSMCPLHAGLVVKQDDLRKKPALAKLAAVSAVKHKRPQNKKRPAKTRRRASAGSA